MKLILLWVIISCLCSCERKSRCIPINSSSVIFLYSDSTYFKNNLCINSLSSDYFLEKVEGKFYLVNDTAYIKFQFNEKYTPFFIIKKGYKNKVEFPFGFNKTKIINLEVIDHLKIEGYDYLSIKFSNCLENMVENELLSAISSFSTKNGFVGSYLTSKKEPNLIISKKGDIFENYFDYSNKRHGTIE